MLRVESYTAERWQPFSISLTTLGVANQATFTRFWLQDQSGTAQPTFYLDDIELTSLPEPATLALTAFGTATLLISRAAKVTCSTVAQAN